MAPKFQCWCHTLFQRRFVTTFKHAVLISGFHVLFHGDVMVYNIIQEKLDHVIEFVVVYLQWPCRRREQQLLSFSLGAICCFNVVLFNCLNIILEHIHIYIGGAKGSMSNYALFGIL